LVNDIKKNLPVFCDIPHLIAEIATYDFEFIVDSEIKSAPSLTQITFWIFQRS
jgi:hypothetical protein